MEIIVSLMRFLKKEIESNRTIKFWLSNITINGVPVLLLELDLNEN